MRKLTSIFNTEEFEEIHYFMDKPLCRQCSHDSFLANMTALINQHSDYYNKTYGHAMFDPKLIYGNKYSNERDTQKIYKPNGNYREILDLEDPERSIGAYFDAPLLKSPLILIIEHENIAPLKQITDTVAELSDGFYKTTSLDKYPIGIIIPLDVVEGGPYIRGKNLKSYANPNSLEFFHNDPIGEKLYDIMEGSVGISEVNHILSKPIKRQ